ncbi:MAG TPA: MFS transporter [Candidatus Thermoplasmatota archaeon]|nr:MFS transporter [Candidatus Thermoplasmatota archaeon]
MTPRRALLLAMAAYVAGQTAHTTFMYHLVPLATRAAGLAGYDAWLFSGIAVAMGLAVIPAGRLADRVPRRRVLRGGLALLGLAYGALLLPPSLPALLLGTAATGVGLALAFVSFNSYVADLLSGAARGAAYGRTVALSVLAGAAGPVLAGLVLRVAGEGLPGIRACAALFGAATLAAIALTWRLPSARIPRAPGRRADRRVLAPVMLLYLLLGTGYGMTAPYFAVYFLDRAGLDGESWGYALGLGTALAAAGSFFAGRLASRVEPRVVAVGGQAGLLGASLLFLLPAGAAHALGYLGRSAFSATTGPVVTTAVMARVDEDVRAESHGWSSAAWNAGWAAGAAAGGVGLALLGPALFPVGALLGFAGVAAGTLLMTGRAASG